MSDAAEPRNTDAAARVGKHSREERLLDAVTRRPILSEAETSIRHLQGAAACLRAIQCADALADGDRELAVWLMAEIVEARSNELGRLVLNDDGPVGEAYLAMKAAS